jgi:ElaB/YqjD/DUF883 family membrane-anchored ribosome-binding protein
MRKHKKASAKNVGAIVEHAQELLTVTAGVAGDNIADARKRLNDALEQGREIYDDVREQAVSRAKAAHKFIRNNPYAALGIGLGIGLIIGFFIRGSDPD